MPISPGELIDKLTILRIKSARMRDADKLANVRAELAALGALDGLAPLAHRHRGRRAGAARGERAPLGHRGSHPRDKERERSFDAGFIELARAVYIENDERAAIKKRINLKLGSQIVEEKSYKEYRPGKGQSKGQGQR